MDLLEKAKSLFLEPEESKFLTDDFNTMVYIIVMNSLGFFYLGFVTSYIATNVLLISGTKLGFVFSSWTIGNIASASLAGAITDKKSKKTLIAIGSFGRGLSYFVCYAAILLRSYNLYLTGYIVLGLGVGLYWTPFDALISEKSHKHHRSYAFSRRYMGIGLGNLVGGMFGFLVLTIGQNHFPENYGVYFSTLIVYGFANWAAGIIFVKKVDEHQKYEYKTNFGEIDGSQTPGSGIEHDPVNKSYNLQSNLPPKKINKTRMLLGLSVLLLAFFLALTNANIAKPFLQVYMMNNITENERNVMLIYLPSGIFSLLIAPKLGKIADRINPNLSIAITSSIGALLTYLLISTYSPVLFAILLCFDVAIANVGGYLLNNIMSRVSKTHRGKVLGARTVFQNLGAFIGPILGGFVYDSLGDRWPFLISIFVELGLIAVYEIAFLLVKTELEEQ